MHATPARDLDGALPPVGTAVAADGTAVAAYDLGGRGPDVLFVHATGFCAQVLRPLAEALAATFHCWALDLRAHGASGRPSSGNFAWSGFAQDVLAVVDYLHLDRPAAFGHSCGGASILLAEQIRPGTFAALACFEPVLLPTRLGAAIGPDNPLSAGARRRRSTFASPAEALANFGTKAPFASFTPEALRAYVAGAFETVPRADSGDGSRIRLRCHREDEAEVYAHGGSHGGFERLGEITCPVALACGATTDSFGPEALAADAAALARVRATVDVLDGTGHFGPMERPRDVAAWFTDRLG